ncbi:flagellar basal body L-ring protein FlgH, partial [Desulfovibrio litoralis]
AREVKVNAETQYMVVTGMARSNDVASDNSILSTQVADLKIEYYGKGIPLAKQKTGWLTRLMDNIWPF